MPRYEYMQVLVSQAVRSMIGDLNKLGADGWRVVVHIPDPDGDIYDGILLLMREVNVNQPALPDDK
jgi:hypothetical protein